MVVFVPYSLIFSYNDTSEKQVKSMVLNIHLICSYILILSVFRVLQQIYYTITRCFTRPYDISVSPLLFPAFLFCRFFRMHILYWLNRIVIGF